MKHFFCLMIAIILTSQFGWSQDSLGLSISGSIDVYYRYNLQGDFDAAPGTSFANLPGFSLGMANLKITKQGIKVGFMADFLAGPRGEDATFLSPVLRPAGSSGLINQLYVYWNVSEEFKLTLGNFNTFLGYEVISPVDNFNYSTSYLFSYGPFSHSGIKVDYADESGFSFMLGIFNPTDYTEYNPSNDYALGSQLGYTFDRGSLFLNGIFSSDFYQMDITAGVDLSDKLYLGLNASKAKNAFTGAAIYFQYETSSSLYLGTRLEYFKDDGLAIFGKNESVTDITLSAKYSIGSLTIIPEFRIDMSSTDIFTDNDEIKSTLSSLVLGALYEF